MEICPARADSMASAGRSHAMRSDSAACPVATWPAGSAAAVYVARPSLSRKAAPIDCSPFMKLTLPVGFTPAESAATWAVNVARVRVEPSMVEALRSTLVAIFWDCWPNTTAAGESIIAKRTDRRRRPGKVVEEDKMRPGEN